MANIEVDRENRLQDDDAENASAAARNEVNALVGKSMVRRNIQVHMERISACVQAIWLRGGVGR
jgi:predicted ATPase